MTPTSLCKQAPAPKHEPMLRDRIWPTNGLYTPMSGEGALPSSVVVIPDTTKSMYSIMRNNNISELYNVGSQRKKGPGETSLPFVYGVELSGPKGEIIRFRSVFDDGALANAIDEKMYLILKNCLLALEPSSRILKMADGRLVPLLGVWKGQVTVKGISQNGVFQVLNSNGAWALLFGKPMLEAYEAVHDYSNDTINLPKGKKLVMLENQFVSRQGITGNLLANLTVNIKQLVDMHGDKTPPPSRVAETTKIEEVSEPSELKPDEEWNHLWTLDLVAGSSATHPGTEQPDISKTFEPTLLTRKTDPHNPAWVEVILAEITLGPDLTSTQWESVHQLISEYAGCFTLSMSEVTTVEGATLPLDIPRDKQFRTKIHQRPQSPPQKEFFNGVINKMLAVDIIRPIAYQDVKCCAATTLAKKTHEGGGVTLDTLKHCINDECVAAGYPSAFKHLPPKEETHLNTTTPAVQNKWRVCQDFMEINQVTKVPPMPQIFT